MRDLSLLPEGNSCPCVEHTHPLSFPCHSHLVTFSLSLFVFLWEWSWD